MKMSREHYDMLSKNIKSIDADLKQEYKRYKKAGMSDRRFRWDVFWASKTRFPVDTYTDEHIDTALRKILKSII